MAKPAELSEHRVAELGLSPETTAALNEIQRELSDAYRDRFIELAGALNRQAAALERVQRTLEILVDHVAPSRRGDVPPMLRVADASEAPDLASAVVVADPIGMGFTLSQSDIARALNLAAPDVSILARALKLPEDERCAVVVRKGAKSDTVNYNARAAEVLRDRILTVDAKTLDDTARKVLLRVRRKLKGR